ncbi:hypothetical protein PV10_04104 [Exophiala mesophila]|uniref:PUM-HD domain-containing protein n=1 Tax=Exophiala mesophila TaxID=212818 RepID=A0A0D1WUB6_EXOME|nr:uncharacterized protein PV10_04104 [Exophiala mesophila]KIV92840.1 hypothetical protein PV10_04104 [Exophiala mesophila]
MEDILARLKLNDARKSSHENASLDRLLTNLQDQNKALKRQEEEIKNDCGSDGHRPVSCGGSDNSDRGVTTALSSKAEIVGPAISMSTAKADAAEIARVKQELEDARSLISRQAQELAETRTLKQTMDQAMGPPSEIGDTGSCNEISEHTIGHLQSTFNASAHPFTSNADHWPMHGNVQVHQELSEPLAGNFGRGRGIWQNHSGSMTNLSSTSLSGPSYTNGRDVRLSSQTSSGVYSTGPISPVDASYQQGRNLPLPNGAQSYGGNDLLGVTSQLGMRRNAHPLRINTSAMNDSLAALGNFAPASSALTPPPITPSMGYGTNHYNYQQRGLPPISPAVTDFPGSSGQTPATPWPISAGGVGGQTYVTSLEPMNYRRLLDKSVSCDWKYIVDKIVCNNDQQASIFLQQKLKVGTAEQKYEIVESIVNQAYPLMINRFGNFLVQRCFEHGTPEQVVAIANAINGNVLSLSMDPFGCHVVQKAFDSVPEDHKAEMVRELLRRIPDTVIHRYACHVWQKLFELRWSGEPPQIMLKVNEALRGMWHEVALGETGSLVVQNIFENCVEDEKRPAIEEVISNIDLIAHGQFGNWCIQHLCEHGSPPDKRRVIDHILHNAYNYSIDQFASKVVEKCLKIGGPEFLDRYLSVITTAHPDRPRIPLIDIAGDQYGNYLIQWILMNTHHHQREQVAIHIRKHMVSLRGSKFGSRVAMLCCNPNSVTRPGPGAAVNPFGAPGQPRNQWARYR